MTKTNTAERLPARNESKALRSLKSIWKSRYIYALMLPGLLSMFIFSYLPIPGVRIAFQDYNIYKPDQSEWVGFENFEWILRSKPLLKGIGNTLILSIGGLIFGFPAPILLALCLNEVRHTVFKKVAQTISYLPHFLSIVVIIGIYFSMVCLEGIVNDVFAALGGERVMILAQQESFLPAYFVISIWQSIGWGSIIYLAAFAGVDTSLYEAAALDGAGRFKQHMYITIPTIIPTISINLVYGLAGILGENFMLVYNLQNAYIDFETISTLIYKLGIVGGQYGPTTAYGLSQGIVNLILLLIANFVVKKLTKYGLF